MDDQIYDRIRNATNTEQIRRLAKGEHSANAIFRFLASILMGEDEALQHTMRIKNSQLDPIVSTRALNTFQWSKAKLALEHPEAIESVHRFEADSKFFRSLVVVCFAIFGLFIADRFVGIFSGYHPFPNIGAFTIAAFPISLLAFWRYVEQRLKATKQAYAYMITLEGRNIGNVRSEVRSDGLTHAGGVVYRKIGNKVQYLLVQASDSPYSWVLPKGHIEPGEISSETAVREVNEETGAWARICNDLGQMPYSDCGDMTTVQFFLMEYAGRGRPIDVNRKHVWLPVPDAVEKATFQETQELLRSAEKRRLQA